MKKERLTKRLALFTALTLTGAMLAGCGNTDAAESSSDAQTGVTADTQVAAGDASADVVYRTLDEIKESGTINIGVFSDKNPFGYVDENGEYQGYDVYFANRLAEDLGVTMEPVGIILMNISLLFSFDRGGIKFWFGWRMEVAGRVGLVF